MAPDLALLEAVRGALIASADLTAHVPAERIRAGSVRSESFPAIVLALPNVEMQGRASGGQTVATLDALLHIWTRDDDAEAAQRIGGAILRALMDALKAEGIWFDRWQRPALAWVADPRNEALHGAVALHAAVRWRA